MVLLGLSVLCSIDSALCSIGWVVWGGWVGSVIKEVVSGHPPVRSFRSTRPRFSSSTDACFRTALKQNHMLHIL